jgi:hypothetical protein
MNMAVVFMYCDYRDQATQTTMSIMGSIAKQLLLQARSIPAEVWEMHKKLSKKQKPVDLETAQATIKLVLEQLERVYICFDALDELQPDVRRQVLEFLGTVSGTTVRLFVTGRPNVESELAHFLMDKTISKIPIVANAEDIELYLSQRFSQDHYREAMDETLQAQIKDKIIEFSRGM